MGWFHLTQLLKEDTVEVAAVVEPYFLGHGKDAAGHGKDAAGSEGFSALMSEHPNVPFRESIEELPTCESGAPHLFLIAGRTVDAKRLFEAAIAKGATHVYLEKPGAATAEELSAMRDLAAAKGVAVVVGYNKNVSEYARDALALLRKTASTLQGGSTTDGATLQGGSTTEQAITLEHCNDFRPGEELVAFMRGPGGEGMLHNMCCHELALATTLFGVTCRRVRRVVLDPARSELIELDGGSGASDWRKVAFRIELAPATAPPPPGGVHVSSLSFSADRCGGNFSRIVLRAPNHLGEEGEEGVGGGDEGEGESAFRLPSDEHQAWVTAEQAKDPAIRPYFLQQAPDYKRLKGDFIAHILSGGSGVPAGVVGLDGAVEALKLADMLKPALIRCSRAGAPWAVAIEDTPSVVALSD